MTDETIDVVAGAKKPAQSGIPTFSPTVSVILLKNIGRSNVGADVGVSERFAGASRSIDLTPYLGEAGTVMTSRSTRQPAGMWSVTLTDRMEPDQEESLYGLIEPLDVVEIRMARDASKYVGQNSGDLPIIMRGFVSEVRRETAMTSSGPRRAVIIGGQDYGKILQIMRIVYLPGFVLGQDLLTAYNLFLNYGVGAEANQSTGDFIQEVIDQAVTPFLQKMIASSGYSGPARSPVQLITVDKSVTEGIISPFGAQNFQGGTAYDLMRYFGDVGAWNELFVEDRDDGPYLVYRPTPFKDLKGKMIQGGTSPTAHDVRDEEIIDISVSRSDTDIANYYWVGAPRFSLISNDLLQLQATGARTPAPFVTDYPNCNPAFYGVRLLQVDTQQGARVDGQPAAEVTDGTQGAMSFIDGRRDILIKNNRDNVVLESGTIQIRGNEAIQAGQYVNLLRGPHGSPVESELYAHTVIQQYSPFRSFLTTIQFDRGTGFVQRVQRGRGAGASGSAYLGESNLSGAYDG